MRSREEMGCVIYRAARTVTEPELFDEELPTWDELPEQQQQVLLACVNAFLEHLFEHGRISSYVNAQQLEAYRQEYKAYLAAKNEAKE